MTRPDRCHRPDMITLSNGTALEDSHSARGGHDRLL